MILSDDQTVLATLSTEQRAFYGALNQALEGEPNLQSPDMQFLNTNYLGANRSARTNPDIMLGGNYGAISGRDIASELLKELKSKVHDEAFKANLRTLSAYSRDPQTVSQDDAVAAYRAVKKVLAKPILKAAIKEGIKVVMNQHCKTAPFAEFAANTLPGPLSDYAANAITKGEFERMLASSQTLSTVFKTLGKKYPELSPENFRAENAEAQMAKLIGRYTDRVLHAIEHMPKGLGANASFADNVQKGPESDISLA